MHFQGVDWRFRIVLGEKHIEQHALKTSIYTVDLRKSSTSLLTIWPSFLDLFVVRLLLMCSIVRLLDLLKERWSCIWTKQNNKQLFLRAGLVKDFSWRQSWSSTSFVRFARFIQLFVRFARFIILLIDLLDLFNCLFDLLDLFYCCYIYYLDSIVCSIC